MPIRKPRNNADECPARKPEGTGLSCQLRGRSPAASPARRACHGRRVASRISSRKASVAATRGLFRGSLAFARRALLAANLVIGGHLEKLGRWLAALDARQTIDRLAASRID